MANDSQGRTALETSAKTVDDAVAQALKQLRLTREDVEIEVLHPGSPGRLLGFGAEPARVRVVAVGRPDTRDDADQDSGAGANEGEVAGAGEAPVNGARRGPSLAGRPSAPRRDSPRTDEEEEARTPEQKAADAEMARLMLAELLNRMQIQGTNVVVTGSDPIQLAVQGEEVADLIGRRGESLRAIQFILNLMINKQLRRRLRVSVDVDGYRERREDLLRSMAERFAHRVRTTGEAMQLETMPPNERRIIHMALSEDPDIQTESTGEGDGRRVVIRPRR